MTDEKADQDRTRVIFLRERKLELRNFGRVALDAVKFQPQTDVYSRILERGAAAFACIQQATIKLTQRRRRRRRKQLK